MSKRIQEKKTGEEPAVAKPRPTCLISRNLLNVRQTSSLDSDSFQHPGRSATGFNFCSREHVETCAGQRSQPNNEFSRVASRQSVSSIGNMCRVCVSVQGALGHRCKVLKIILKGQDCISTLCKSLIICALIKSSRTFDRTYVVGLMYLMMRRPMY